MELDLDPDPAHAQPSTDDAARCVSSQPSLRDALGHVPSLRNSHGHWKFPVTHAGHLLKSKNGVILQLGLIIRSSKE